MLIKGQFTLGAMGMKLQQLPLFILTTILSEEKIVTKKSKNNERNEKKWQCFDWYLQ